MSTDDTSLDAELRALLAEGRKIEAIKRYREATGEGLAAAKDAVEALEQNEPPAAAEPADAALETQIVSLLEAGRKIEAIKVYRERTGAGLKEAKDAVESIAAERQTIAPIAPSGSGCLGVIVLFVAAVLLAVADSWVYVYNATDLSETARHKVPEVVYGAGGMANCDGRFIVVGGLPKDFEENYAYEYDKDFKFVKRHVIDSGYTSLGIQTATCCGGHWWFGCYGNPPVLLKTDSAFHLAGKYTFDSALGIAALQDGSFLVGRGKYFPGKGHTGRAFVADPDPQKGLVIRTEAIGAGDAQPDSSQQPMKLWKEIDISPYKGTFPCLGDLDGDGRVDFLLYRQGPQTTPGYMVALNHDGKKLWEMGDPSIKSHMPDGQWKEPALRGIAFIYDIDQDGKSDAIAEFWRDGKPMLYVLDGATGAVKHARESPFNLDIRGGKRSRCHPVGRVARLQGQGHPPAIVLLYGASNCSPGQVVALDATLQTLWSFTGGVTSIAHMPSIGDVNGDGKDEIVAGISLVDANGRLLWEKTAANHADCTAVVDLGPDSERSILMSICNSGPAYCLSPRGDVLWEKSTKEVSHGQGIWAGNFIDKEPGLEVIILKSGHRGDFLTVRAEDGRDLATFQHRRELEGYPDFPCVVNWLGHGVQSLWIPIDRCLVDGHGNVVAELGSHEERVRNRLQWGTTKSHVAVQAFAVDLCGDEREEMVLYQPYHGESIFIFTQPDSDGRDKPYVHRESVYQIRSYF